MKLIVFLFLLVAIMQLFGAAWGQADFLFPDQLDALLEQRNNFNSRSKAPTNHQGSEEDTEESSNVNLENRSFLNGGCKTGYVYVSGKCRKVRRIRE